MLEPGIAVLLLAFGLGLLHALDADHIAAVSALATEKRGKLRAIRRSLLWAMGHGIMLLLIGAAVLLFGQAIPESLSHWAEVLVGVVLMLIGVMVLRDLKRRGLQLHFHKHEGLPAHAHWHEAGESKNGHSLTHSHRHAPLLVGTLHGAAGSAPLLAILPFSQQQDPWLGMAYLVLFSLGVFLAMLSFGGVLEWLLHRLSQQATRAVHGLQTVIGLASIGLGALVIHGAL
ncbi:MAG: sulfite exporter TauE/SafE family protein [Gammaproteobacteria bacterium]|nr:sulfite exporter TauE/SafE family protein [Gammaproteobacteria bacterium]